MKKITLIIAFITFIILSCDKDDGHHTHAEDLKYGNVIGKVVTNNDIEVGSALVFYDYEGEIYHTLTQTDGTFELKIPVGTGDFHIQTGKGKLFRTVTEITISENEVVDLTNTESMKLKQQANLAYIAGAFDSIQDLVVNMGYTIDQITIADLANPNLYDDYAAVFLNCDLAVLDDATANNMTDYVAQGGSLYASDWAIGYYLGADNGSGTSCGVRSGGFIDDATICTEKMGNRPALYNSPILSPEYQTVLGKTEMDIDSGVWTIVHDIDTSFWDVIVEDTTGTPLVIKTDDITSNNVAPPSVNGNWVTICHIPPGNPNNPITITINSNALAAHLAHGDSLDGCDSVIQSGNVFYTTFENHQSGPSAIVDVKKILEHIILSL